MDGNESGRYWFSVVVNRTPTENENGIVLSEGFQPEAEFQDQDLQYAILARVRCSSLSEANSLVQRAAAEFDPIEVHLISDRRESVIRRERQASEKLQVGDVSMTSTFVGFKSDSEVAKHSALRIVASSICKRWWEIWR